MRVQHAIAGLSLLAVVGLSACGTPGGEKDRIAAGEPASTSPQETSTPEPTVAQPPADPCAVVSKREAEVLAGTPLEDGVAVREMCTYTGPVSGPTAQVEVYVGDGAKKFLDIDRDLGHDFRPVVGAGDEAYVEDDAVFVRKGVVWVAVRLVRLDDPAVYRTRLEDLARTVATRI